MWGRLNRFFPHRTKTLSHFIDLVRKEQNLVIQLVLTRQANGWGVKTRTVGLLANYRYVIEIGTVLTNKHRIIWRSYLLEQWESEYGYGDAQQREQARLTVYLATAGIIRNLKRELPGVTIRPFNLEGGPLGEDELRLIHAKAANMGTT